MGLYRRRRERKVWKNPRELETDWEAYKAQAEAKGERWTLGNFSELYGYEKGDLTLIYCNRPEFLPLLDKIRVGINKDLARRRSLATKHAKGLA